MDDTYFELFLSWQTLGTISEGALIGFILGLIVERSISLLFESRLVFVALGESGWIEPLREILSLIVIAGICYLYLGFSFGNIPIFIIAAITAIGLGKPKFRSWILQNVSNEEPIQDGQVTTPDRST